MQSTLFQTHVLLISILGATPNPRTTLTYSCPCNKKSNRTGQASFLSTLTFYDVRRSFLHQNCHQCSKIDVFNALRTRLGPSKYTSLKKNPTKRNPRLKTKTSSKVPRYNFPATTSVGHCHYKKWSSMVDYSFFTLY